MPVNNDWYINRYGEKVRPNTLKPLRLKMPTNPELAELVPELVEALNLLCDCLPVPIENASGGVDEALLKAYSVLNRYNETTNSKGGPNEF